MGVVTGEKVQFGDLLRGMMYPSGNDAAIAVAEHVAQGKFGPSGTYADFVDEMNTRAAAIGLTHTHFTNPAGLDCFFGDCTHHTTAREMAKWFTHAIGNDYYQQIVGFVGTYTFSTVLPGGGTKNYALGFPFFSGGVYPGFEGGKGGGTSGCNGPNNGCMVMSAVRNGRRIVLAFMQGVPWVEETPLFDYGFSVLFHTDFLGQGPAWHAIQDSALECTTGSRAVSAALRFGHPVKLIVWGADGDTGDIVKLAESPELIRGPPFLINRTGSAPRPGALGDAEQPLGRGGPGPGPVPDPPGIGKSNKPVIRQVALAQLAGGVFITAVRTGGSVELTRWRVAADNTVTKVSGGHMTGPATSVALQPVFSDTVLLAMKAPNGTLVMQTWSLAGRVANGLFLEDTYYDAQFAYKEVSLTGPGLGKVDPFNGHRAFSIASTLNMKNVQQTWGVDASGTISLMAQYFYGSTAAGLATSPAFVEPLDDGDLFPPSFYAHAYRSENQLHIRFSVLDDQGSPLPASGGLDLPEDLTNLRLEPFGSSGLLIVGRQADGSSRFLVIETRRSNANTIKPYVIAEHTSLTGTDFEVCRQFTTHAEGDFLVARRMTTSNELRVSAYRVGDRPF
jgi:hypothetical protein